MTEAVTGGCQCGAVRYRAGSLGRSTICHCRMCQKATGGLFATLVTAHDVVWTRGERAMFESSNKNQRGFCRECGTPLTYEMDGGLELTVGSLDDPDLAAPVAQNNAAYARPCFSQLSTLPLATPEETKRHDEYNATITSNQHPDHDTESWPEAGA